MPRIQLNKERMEGRKPLADGLYTVRLDGFEPAFSKGKDSYNLNPKMVVVNHAEHNGERVFDNLNTKADWIILAFCHAFGVNVNGDMTLPGEFLGPDDDPSKWNYQGPLLGQTAQVMLKQTTYNGKTNTKVDQYLCKIGPTCSTRHPNGLAT